ncbi:MAG: CHASE3 domain-containing protein [Nitrospirota bacterium]|nr:CHASE3 domain-containing protein [Nitrospirota bacterium]
MSLHGIWSGKGLYISLIVGFIAVESIVAACFLSLVHFKTSTNRVSQSQHALIELERMVGTVTEAETSQRGYLITGSDRYLAPYRDAVDTVATQIRRIASLTRHNVTQQDRVAYLATQVEQRSDEMDHAIVTRRTEGLPFAKSVVVGNQQNRTMDTIHDIAGQIREEETRILERHRADSEAWALTAGSFTVGFFLVTAVLFTLCGVIMKMAFTSQAQAERILQTFPRASTAPMIR